MIKLIVAIGPDGLIGSGDKMPWHITEEFKHFKNTTMGHTLFMGGKTFKALPGKLPGRKFALLDLIPIKEADVMLNSIEEAKEFLQKFKDSKEIVFIAGGKFVYETFYQLADELIISEVKTDKKGDVFLTLNLSNYSKTLLKDEPKFKVFRYTK